MSSLFDFGFSLASLPAKLPAGHVRQMISSGPAGTAQTIRRMAGLVTHGKRDFRIRTLAGQIIKNCQQKDYPCYGKSLYEWCRDQIKYVWDPNGVELIEEPWKIVESGVADCDSIVVLLASLAESCGFPCKFVTIKSDPMNPNEYTHVYLKMKVPPMGWVAADPTMHEKSFGWEPPDSFVKTEWNASDDPPEGGDPNDGMNIPQLPDAKLNGMRGSNMRGIGSLALADNNDSTFLQESGSAYGDAGISQADLDAYGNASALNAVAGGSTNPNDIAQARRIMASQNSMFTPLNIAGLAAAAYFVTKKNYLGAGLVAGLLYLNYKRG